MSIYYLSMSEFEETKRMIDAMFAERDYASVIEFINKKMAETTDKAFLSLLLYEKGKVLYYMGKIKESQELLDESLSLLDNLSTDLQGVILFSIASVYLVMGEVHNAEMLFRKTLEILPETDHHYIAALNNLGDMYKRQEKYSEAENYFKKCYHLSLATSNNFMAAYSSEGLAGIYAVRGMKSETRELLERALKYSRDAGDTRLVRLLEITLKMLNGTPIDVVKRESMDFMKLGTYRAHDIADAFMIYSSLLPSNEQKVYLREAINIYSDVGDVYMEGKAIKRLESLNRRL